MVYIKLYIKLIPFFNINFRVKISGQEAAFLGKMFKSLSFVTATSFTAFAAAVAVSAGGNEKLNNEASHYDTQYMSELSAAASSAVESFLSIKPMFDLNPVDSTSKIN